MWERSGLCFFGFHGMRAREWGGPPRRPAPPSAAFNCAHACKRCSCVARGQASGGWRAQRVAIGRTTTTLNRQPKNKTSAQRNRPPTNAPLTTLPTHPTHRTPPTNSWPSVAPARRASRPRAAPPCSLCPALKPWPAPACAAPPNRRACSTACPWPTWGAAAAGAQGGRRRRPPPLPRAEGGARSAGGRRRRCRCWSRWMMPTTGFAACAGRG